MFLVITKHVYISALKTEEFISNMFHFVIIFYLENKFSNNVPRRLIHNTETKKLQQRTLDHDDNKYERRTMSEKFTRFHM